MLYLKSVVNSFFFKKKYKPKRCVWKNIAFSNDDEIVAFKYNIAECFSEVTFTGGFYAIMCEALI